MIAMYIVERIISKDMALLEAEDGTLTRWHVDTSGIREGDVATIVDGALVPNMEATQRRKEKIRARFDQLKAD